MKPTEGLQSVELKLGIQSLNDKGTQEVLGMKHS